MRIRPGAVALLALFAAAAARAGPEKRDTKGDSLIRWEDIEPYREEFHRHVRMVQTRKMEPKDLIELYARKAAKKRAPREAAVHAYIYASLLVDLERYREARAELERALKLWPGFPPAYWKLGDLAERQGDNREAKRLVRKALDLNPLFIHAMLDMGRHARMEGKLDEAKHWYERSFKKKYTPQAFWGLGRVYVAHFRSSYNEEKKKEYARMAGMCAERIVDLDPEDGMGHLRRAQIYRDVGATAKAAESLEASMKDRIPPRVKFLCLRNLFDLYAMMRDLEKVESVLERMLKHDDLKAEVRERYKKMLRQLRERGAIAFLIWAAEQQMELLKNEGISPTDRRTALRILLTIYIEEIVVLDPSLRPLRAQIFKTIFRVLVTAPPKISTEVFHFLRTEYPDPHLLRILVHFVYPYDDATRTPEVRVQAVRTLATVAGVAAVPTLFYCLSDEPGEVVREVDMSLAKLCEVRSPVGEGITKLTPKEAQTSRNAWREYFQTADGVHWLKEAFLELRKYAEMDAQFNRQLTNKPIANHIANTILLDGDMPWEAWKAAYEFLVDYLNKEFRPVKRRGKPVEEWEREGQPLRLPF